MIMIILGGQFGGGGGVPFDSGYGRFSMNLLSPIVPQNSGLFPWIGGVIDADYQYEGFNYLGVGLLLATLLMMPAEVGWLRRNMWRHISLLVACAALTGFAISHRVYAGHWLLLELPVPHYIAYALGTFRSSGRFFWLVGYAQMAIVLILGFRRPQPVIALCLVGAAILQLFDVQPLRKQIVASIAAGPGTEELERTVVAHLVAVARHVEIVPSFQCNLSRDQQQKRRVERANLQLMLAMARINRPTNTVDSARQFYGLTFLDVVRMPSLAREMLRARRDDYCQGEINQARTGGLPGDVIVLLSDRPRTEEMAPGVTCSPLSWGRYCERSKQ